MDTRQHRAMILGAFVMSLVGSSVFVCGDADAQNKRRKRPPKPSKAKFYSFDDMGIDAELGVTPGGSQDISYLRDQLRRGVFPPASTFTPEGLFSEHDLPIRSNQPCSKLICVRGEAVRANIAVQPEVQQLAQLGFSSGIDAKTFRRAPLHLVAVIDKSGSMSGQPLDLVKRSLSYLVSHKLGSQDQLSIVLYGDRSHVHMKPTKVVHKSRILQSIASIESAGSTNMEEGLAVGFHVAAKTRAQFQGVTRVMLFTDEQPNVGRTDAESFMGMAREGASQGVGMTTVGVGVQFGAELAKKISNVRGGNLFFFPDGEKMASVFREDFDTMVTALAYDLKVTLEPAEGWVVADVYGVPGAMLQRTEKGEVSFGVETMFASRKKGAIFVSLKRRGSVVPVSMHNEVGDGVLRARVAYTPLVSADAGKRVRDEVVMRTVKVGAQSDGLRRGEFLVNEAVGLKRASELFHDNRTQEALIVTRSVLEIMERDRDTTLASERDMVRALLRGLQSAKKEMDALDERERGEVKTSKERAF